MAGSKFTEAVWTVIRAVPRGRVVSYGQVAAYAGVPRAARAVGWLLRQSHDESVPWWRVINNAGRISIKANWFHDAAEQKKRLRAEGVEVGERFEIEIEKYRWAAGGEQLRRWIGAVRPQTRTDTIPGRALECFGLWRDGSEEN